MIPGYIKRYLYSLDFVHVKNDLLAKGVGAFAFYTMYVDTTDNLGQKRTMEWAMMNAAGNEAIAKLMLRMPDDHSFGFASVLDNGEIEQYQFFCELVRRKATSMATLIPGLQKAGFKIDPQKLCDPARMYRR